MISAYYACAVAEGINLKAAPGTTFAFRLPLWTAALGMPDNIRFLPREALVYLRTMTGPALTTAPGIKIGTNAGHTNIAPLFTPPVGVAVNAMGVMPLAAGVNAPSVGVAGILVELANTAVGPTAMTGDVLLAGMLVIDA